MKILIIDDHPIVRTGLRRLLAAEPEAELCEAASGKEALSNAVRHAEPDLVTISIERGRDAGEARDEVKLVIADDGRGYGQPDRLGYGLLGISERVRALGGHLRFANTQGEGFAVIAVVPHPHRSDSVATSTEAAAP